MRKRSVLAAISWMVAGLATALGTSAEETSGAVTASKAAPSTWVVPGDVPFPEWARSVEILREDESLSIAPSGARRGLVALGVRLPLLGAIRGPGCISRWLLVGPLAYVCSDKIQFSAELPGVPESIHPTPEGGLPYRYYFVGAEGADAYAKLADVEDETPIEQLDKGWAIASVGEVTFQGTTYVRTRKNHYIAKKQLGPATGSGFHGEVLSIEPGVAPNVGFVMPDKANVFIDAKAGSKSAGARTRLQKVDVLETKKLGKDTWHRIGDAQWMRAVDLRVPTLAPPPDGLLEGERWIDIDTTNQTLVAYEGTRAVFATVVSTGRVAGSTPKGTFRIWVKLRSTTMSNADDPVDTTEEAATYSIEDVPWVQYFSNGVAIHGAFWHRQFGRAHSHGCVNLAPLDALRLFEWTGPRLPRGWDAVFPTTAEPATLVKVR
jgi:hypothetical protein